MAHLAGIDYSLGLSSDHMTLTVFGYNDGISKFINEILRNLQSFNISEQFFENIRQKSIRNYENSKKQEPYQRIEARLYNYLMMHSRHIDEYLGALKEELTYDKFLEMKKHWLKNMQTEWFIIGHIKEE